MNIIQYVKLLNFYSYEKRKVNTKTYSVGRIINSQTKLAGKKINVTQKLF